jgi:hypothetical protein
VTVGTPSRSTCLPQLCRLALRPCGFRQSDADTQLLAGGLDRNRAYLHLITVRQRREHGRNTQGSHNDLSSALTVTERPRP